MCAHATTFPGAVETAPHAGYDGAMRIGVYGLGRFGRLWAEMLAERTEVIAANRSPVKEAPTGVEVVEMQELRRCDVLFLCVAISAVQEVARKLATVVEPGQVVADTCSVKVKPLEWLRAELPEEVQLLGTHPMFGPDSVRDAEASLPMVVTPERIDPERYRELRELFRVMGLEVREMSAEDHDREAAYTQGITHLVGRVLADFGVPDSEIATLGYRRLQQVMEQTCNDPYRLFLDLQHHNPYTSRMRARFTHAVDAVLESLEANVDTPKG